MDFTGWWDETRAALRTLRRHPARSSAVVVLLGAGVGISAATCSLVRATAFGPLPQMGAERLVTPVSARSDPGGTAGLVSDPQFLEWRDHPELGPARSANVLFLRDRVVSPSWRTAALVLLAAVAAVQLLCCANVAHLLLAAVLERRRDVATRLAMGATPARAVRQVVVETTLLVLASAAVGGCAAAGLVRAIRAWAGAGVPGGAAVGASWETVAFALAIALVVAIPLAATAAAGALRGASVSILRGAPREGAASVRPRTRALLVAAQLALSVVLMLCAGLMVRSVDRPNHDDPGFDSAQLLELRIRTPPGRYPSPQTGPRVLNSRGGR